MRETPKKREYIETFDDESTWIALDQINGIRFKKEDEDWRMFAITSFGVFLIDSGKTKEKLIGSWSRTINFIGE